MKEHHCKRCGDRIPAASPDGIKIVYLGTVGPNSPDVPPELEGLCFPCLGDDAEPMGETFERFGNAIGALGKAL